MSLEEAGARLFRMNELTLYFEQGATIMTIKELNKKCISKKSLKGEARLLWHQKDGPKLTEKTAILKTLRRVEKELQIKREIDEEAKIASLKSLKLKPEPTTSLKQQQQQQQLKAKPDDNQGTTLKNPCRKHNGQHEWDNCKFNPKNRYRW